MKEVNFKNILKELRRDANLRQKDIALFLGVAESTYSSYEQGRNEPDLNTLVKLASYFNVTVGYLLGLED